MNVSIKKEIIPKHYSEFRFSTPIPDLLDVQRDSFWSFITHGLKEAFENPLIFSSKTQILEIHFFPELIQFKPPEVTQTEAIFLGKTYSSAVYIPVNLKIKTSTAQETRREWLLLGHLPLMTKHGHFVINGISRVVLHQLIRNPGVYTIPQDSRTQAPTIRIVPEQGGWMNLTADKKYRLWFHSRALRRRVSLLVVLLAVGVSYSELFQQVKYSNLLPNSFVKEFSKKWEENQEVLPKTRHDEILYRAGLYEHPRTQDEAIRYLYSHYLQYNPYARDQLVTSETAQEFFWNKFWKKDVLVLGKIGRQQFHDKVGSSEPLSQMHLTATDLVASTQALLKLLYKERLGDEIDSLTQKRLRGCDKFLEDQLLRGISEFDIFMRRKVEALPSRDTQTSLQTVWRQNQSVLSKFVSKAWKSFFTSGTLAQFMDQTNPLAELTHKRRVTVLGPGGVSSKQTTIQIRGIHPTFYGRLCPIETPEGKNAGLVNSFTVFAKPSKEFFGTITTPFYTVYKGQVQKNVPPVYLAPHQEDSIISAPADLVLNPWNLLPMIHLPVRKDLKFESEASSSITTQSVGVLQTISVATSLIPFLEHDDANRALMGSNMQRQAVPLLKPEAPAVGTGLETRVISDVKHGLQAAHAGYITQVTARGIRTVSLPVTPSSLSLPKNQNRFLGQNFFWRQLSQEAKLRKSDMFSTVQIFSSQASGPLMLLSHKHRDVIPKNNIFGEGTTPLAERTEKEKIVATWLSHSQLTQKKQAIIHKTGSSPKKVSFLGQETKVEKKRSIQKHYIIRGYQRTNQSTCLYEKPVVPETKWVEKGDLLADGCASVRGKLAIGKNLLVAYVPWEGYNFEDAILISERLVDQDILTSLHIDHYEIEVKNTQHGLEKITNQIPLKFYESSRESQKVAKLNAKGLVEIGSWVEPGDYLVGKVSPMGSKGPSVEQQYEKLFSAILQREKTTVRNTSLRVPKGVEGFVLDVNILPSREPDVAALAQKQDILRVRVVLLQRRRIQVGDKMAGRHGNKGIVSNILPRQDMPYLPDGTPVDVVLNPLGVPSRMNVGQIFECLLGLAGRYLQENYTTNLFDEQYGPEASRSLVYSKLFEASLKTTNPWLFEPHHPGKMKLFDGRTGLPFDQPVTVGCAYMLKLVHMVDDKIHARATGPYSAVTQQPVRGRSRNGGQRLGEMEVWALQAYGAAQTLHELFTLKSDDIEGRSQALFQIYANKRLPVGRAESFKLIFRELQSLCFDLELYGFQKGRDSQTRLSVFRLQKLLEENTTERPLNRLSKADISTELKKTSQ